MTSGGARGRSGPAPDLDAFARERDKGDWVLLPAKWSRRAPKWPLPSNGLEELHPRELALWKQLWAQGQAPMWLINKQEHSVAVYVRLLAIVEISAGVNSSSILAELRRQREDLGLSQAGLARNKWRFAAQGEVSVAAAEKAAAAAPAAGKGKAGNVTDLFSGVKVRGA